LTAALDGLRVIDFSRVLAGPLATMLLADLGATVVKIERPGTGDDTRAWGPPHDEAGVATYFLSVNRGKQSRALDLGEPSGAHEALGLAAGADVVVENFRPGVMDRLGLGYEELSRRNSGLVYCSLTGFGSGAGAELPGYDLLLQAVGGLMSITGEPDGEPQKVGVALVDVIAGLFATVGILAALRHRDRTGAGQRVEVDLLSSLLAGLVNQASAYTAAGVVAKRIGNAHPSIAPYEPLATADGEVVLAVGNDRQFRSLAEVVGAPEWADDPRFTANPDRVRHQGELRNLLQERLRSRPSAEWIELLTEAGVPAGKVNNIAEAFELAERLGLPDRRDRRRGRARGGPAAKPDQALRHPAAVPKPAPRARRLRRLIRQSLRSARRAADQAIVRVGLNLVAAPAASDHVSSAVVDIDLIITGAGFDPVSSLAAGDAIIAAGAEQAILARAPGDAIAAALAEDAIAAPRPHQPIGARGANQPVRAGTGIGTLDPP
jgi:crotonobetainyl-CoA:carnitine CoA-transferase CaiB-like acyl-CoA transferase